jgi:GAF domain-containing protein
MANGPTESRGGFGANSLHTQAFRYAGAGILFGVLFPVVAFVAEAAHLHLPIGISSLQMLQKSEPLLWIIETAPFFLGLVAALAGRRQDLALQANKVLRNRELELTSIRASLEQRVSDRTDALEQQTLRLRTAAEVARDAASAPRLDDLLDQAAQLILDRFGFYHTGIFLADEKHEYAVLRASPSVAGKAMLANRHKLRIGEQGIVGNVAATGEPRIAMDTGNDPVYFSNPYLPNTHSEMALPLKTAEGTIGVIDIQSDQPEAFTQDDIAIVQVMADQLAIAIQRTSLMQQVQQQLQQLEQSQKFFTQQAWHGFTQAGPANIGYRFDNVRLEPIREHQIQSAQHIGEKPGTDIGSYLEVPIRLRGQMIGTVRLRFQANHVPEMTAAVSQQIADRLATALENARLLEESYRRANKERAIGEIASRISASVNMRNVLQTAVEELGRAIPGSDVMIQLRPDSERRH